MEPLSQIISKIPLRKTGTCQSDLLQLKADAINETIGILENYDCFKCKNRGFIAAVREKKDPLTEEIIERDVACHACECMPVRKSLKLIERSGLKPLLSSCTFKAYNTPEKWQLEAKEKAMQFVSNYEGNWFYISGASGGGKTHLCTAICGEMLKKGIEVRYMLWRDEVVKLKAVVNSESDYQSLILPLKTVDLLYIDDLFKKPRKTDKPNEWIEPTTAEIEIAHEIINSRGINPRLITIISTERIPENLLDIDEALGGRIFQRSREYCVRIEGDGKNWRLK